MLRFVVALECESRPIVEHYRLDRNSAHHAFKVFRRDQTALIVSGIGKAAAAAATAYLHLATGGERDAAWINAGIAGHRSKVVGEALVAHKIHDVAAGRSWYPPRLARANCDSGEVATVDRPETVFPAAVAYEMEASGFYSTACRFATSELVQCVKIVSDGPAAWRDSTPAADFSTKAVTELVAAQIETVVAVAESCREISGEVRRLDSEPAGFGDCLGRWHFTVTQKRQLRQLLRRRQTLFPGLPLPLETVADNVRGGEINRRLSDWLNSRPVILGAGSSEAGP